MQVERQVAKGQRQARDVADVLDRMVVRVHAGEEAERQHIRQVRVLPKRLHMRHQNLSFRCEALREALDRLQRPQKQSFGLCICSL